MKYRYLLIDNDNTLMDFHAAEHAALREALTEAGIEPTDAASAHGTAPSMTHSGRHSNAAKPPMRRSKSPVLPSFWQNTPPKTSAHPASPCATATISARTLTSCPARRRFCAACTGR